MDVSLHVATFSWADAPGSIAPKLAETARVAEEGGVAGITLMDHFFQLEGFGVAEQPMLEGYTALGFLAGRTERIRLSLLVTGVTYRHPALLAKTVATLDVLAGGRAQLGIGAAWYEREHVGLGVPFPPMAERFERLEEAIQICKQMWSGEVGPFEGKHYQLAETLCDPLPLARPHLPVLIGGSGERKTLRFVARYADACNLFASSADEVAHKLDVLRGHCETEGRDYDSITKTMLAMGNPLSDPAGFVEQMRPYAALGITQVDLIPLGDPVGYAERACADLVPALRELG
jgi:F420-dependent oxidoreductase-like protein